MSYSDWDPDDLLNFDYGKSVPEDRHQPNESNFYINDMPKTVRSIDDDNVKLYERLRRESTEDIIKRAKAEAQDEVYQKYTNKKPPKSNKKRRSDSVNNKNKGTKLYKFAKFLSLIYIVALAAFVLVMTTMNILPFFMLIAMYIVLGLLSLILIIQLSKDNIKRWAKVVSTALAILLIFVYGIGCAYALGTLSFLDKTSKNAINNNNRVGKITKEPFNIAMTGMDVYGTIDEQGRSDVNMIVTINPVTEQILMTSIPRDYEVRLPDMGYATDKLTHSGFYSVDTTIHAEEDLLGITDNYYVKVNFTTVQKFVNAIGGIDVYSDEEFNPVKMPEWTVQQGLNHMDGKQALAFARERKSFLTGDNKRIENQQAVFEAMLKKLTSSKTMVLSYNKVLNELDDYFEMNFSSSEIRTLIRFQLAKGPKWKIYKNTLVGGNGSMGTYTTGSSKCYVMTQDPTSIANASELIQAVMNGKKLKKDKETDLVMVVEETDETQDVA